MALSLAAPRSANAIPHPANATPLWYRARVTLLRSWLPVVLVLGLAGYARGDGRRPPPVPLARATTVHVLDRWSGFGCRHRFEASLRRRGDAFVGDATLDAHGVLGGDLGPFPPRRASVPRSVVVALARAVDDARAAMRSAPPALEGAEWSDDSPATEMTFRGGAGTHRLWLAGPHRVLHLERGAADEALNPPRNDPTDPPSAVLRAYEDVLDAAGMGAWLDEACRDAIRR